MVCASFLSPYSSLYLLYPARSLLSGTQSTEPTVKVALPVPFVTAQQARYTRDVIEHIDRTQPVRRILKYFADLFAAPDVAMELTQPVSVTSFSTSALPASSLTSSAAADAPLSMQALTISAPMPWLPPVTTILLSASCNDITFFPVDFRL